MGIRSWWQQTMGTAVPVEERSILPLSFNEWLSMFTFEGNGYTFGPSQSFTGNTETIGGGFTGLVDGAYKSNAVVAACELARLSLFSQASFQFQGFKEGRPGRMYGNRQLIPLREPWKGGTLGDLLSMMLLDADLAGNAFVHRRGDKLVRLRPDWVTIVFAGGESAWSLETEVVGYLYQEGGPSGGQDPIALDARTVAHFMPYPDPLAPRLGMPWLTPVLREIAADSAFTQHKQAFVDHGATVNFAIEYDPAVTKEVFDFARDSFAANHEGMANAGKVLHLLGAKAVPVGSNLQQMDYTSVQNIGIERIASVSGIHPTILGMAGGLEGSSLNQGNFAAARRLTADKCLRPLWNNVAGSLSHIIEVPAGDKLAPDLRDVAFLREDEKDAADIQEVQARTITTYVNAGYDPASVAAAVEADDITKLKHTNLLSVQLQPPMPNGPPEPKPEPEPVANGKVPQP